ncbi:MAG: NAD(P)/FAD-dependent oxidoreductase [Synechococcus sp.]
MTAQSPGPEADTARPVVIVGGGFAGLTLALKLSRATPRPGIILVEPRKHFVFLPLLYELLSGELQPWEVAPSYDNLLNNSGIAVIHDRVTAVHWTNNEVHTASGQCLAYSQLVLATGSEPNDFGVPGVKQHALYFHSLEDVTKLKQRLKDLQRRKDAVAGTSPALVIVGAGAAGVELACKLADLTEGRFSLHLIEQGDRILPMAKAFNREQAEACLKQHGVHCHLTTRVEAVTPNTVSLRHGDQSTVLPHQGLIWTAGNKPKRPQMNPEIAPGHGRLMVDEALCSNDLPDCLVLGDLAMRSNAISNTVESSADGANTTPWPCTAQVAMQQGEAAARTVIALHQGQTPEPFEFRDLGEMLSLGVGKATITGLGLTLAGPLAFKLRRVTYLARLPKLSLGLRSAGAWLLSR